MRFGALVQILQQMVDRGINMLRGVDGFSTPGRILWTGECQFEAVVSIVSSEMPNCLGDG